VLAFDSAHAAALSLTPGIANRGDVAAHMGHQGEKMKSKIHAKGF
jgi:hypothetical protein